MHRFMLAVLVLLAVSTGAAASPAVPADARAVLVPVGVLISWRAPGAAEVDIERRVGDGSFAAIATVAAAPGTFIDPAPAGPMTYRLRARTGTGESGWTTDIVPQPTVIRLAVGRMSAQFNGITAELDAPPLLHEDRTYLPVRYLAEAVGAQVGWDPVSSAVTVKLSGRTLVLLIGSSVARIDGWPVQIDPENPKVTPIVVEPGRTMLPLRFVAEALGCSVHWDSTSGEITIQYGTP